MDAQVHGYDIKSVIPDLGYDVNILPKNSWESNGFPSLVYSTIQSRMENQYHIFPIGQLENVEVDLIGVQTFTNFKVIEIMGGTNSHLDILCI